MKTILPYSDILVRIFPSRNKKYSERNYPQDVERHEILQTRNWKSGNVSHPRSITGVEMKTYKVGNSEYSLQVSPERNIIGVVERKEGQWVLSEAWVVIALQDQCNA
jgi:hypothetical protein